MTCPVCAGKRVLLKNSVTNEWEDCYNCDAVGEFKTSCPVCNDFGYTMIASGSDIAKEITCPNCQGRAKISPEHNLSTFNVEDSVDEAWELTHERKYS